MRSTVIGVLVLVALFTIDAARAEEQAVHVCRYCDHGSAAHFHRYFAPADGAAANGRQYPPDRIIDVLNVKIDVTPDFDKRTVAGQTTITFVPIAKPLARLTLDAVDLKVTQVTGSAAIADHHVSQSGIEIVFKEPIAPGKETSITVTHSAEPRHGLYFRTPAQGYKPQDMHLWTQGETHEARHWFPSIDYPNERFTSEVICRVSPDLTVISNGRLVSETVDEKSGLKVVHWKQDRPHVNYLIALAAGRFKSIEGPYQSNGRTVPMRFYTPASQIEHAQNSFKDTADMMAFFERETGAPYPWHRYDQVVVDDFHWGGMENTTLTILNDFTLHPANTAPNRSSQNLVAHELIHQWFGDLITCRDWSHLWLNEGFATYYAHLYDGHKHGRDSMLYGLYRDRLRITGNKNERRPIVYNKYQRAYEQFDTRAYAKGGWVLHMLRTQLGEDLFRRCIIEYVKVNADRSVVTQDLQDACERISGLSLDQFFDQWIYHARHPQLTVTQSWDGVARLAKVSVKQTHTVDDDVLLFSFPVKLRFRTAQGVVETMVQVKEKEQDFFIALPAKPLSVRFDADAGLLGEVQFDLPLEMVLAQLQDMDDVVGRLLAVEALAKNDAAGSVAALAKALNGDPFWGVRVEASKALRKIQTDAARQALLASIDQPDARARKQVVEDIGAIHHPDSKAALLRLIDRGDTHLDVAAQPYESLGRYEGQDVASRLLAALKSDSYRQAVMLAAIRGIRKADDPAYIAPLLEALTQRESDLRSRDFGDALDALAWIARNQHARNEDNRNEDHRAKVRAFLTGHLSHPKRDVKLRAVRALGTLGDPRAIAAIETYDTGNEEDPVSRAAREVLQSLRENKPAAVEVRDLRSELERLKQSNDALRREFDELKKKLEATQTPVP